MDPDTKKPVLVYDGDCGICRYWINYWQKLTGDSVEYLPYQEVAGNYPGITLAEFERSIQLVPGEDTVYSGARAVYFLLRKHFPYNILYWLYLHLPGFPVIAEAGYTFFSRHRGLLRFTSLLLWGKQHVPAQYHLTRWLFLRLLGLIYLSAFISFGVQITGLAGAHGILPVSLFLQSARDQLGGAAFFNVPTVFWLSSNDLFLNMVCITGAVFSLLLTFNILCRTSLIINYVLYLSLFYAGQVFMQFQWDLLLLECGFLAIFLSGKSKIIVWLYRWLVFRFMFLGGLVKIFSGDPSWDNLTALNYHFETQPLPTPLAWYAHHLPDPVLASLTAGTLTIELLMPFLIIMPRNIRFFAGFCFFCLQFSILLTGNYNFFNLLTISMLLFLYDDAAIGRFFPEKLKNRIAEDRPARSATITSLVIATVIISISTAQLWGIFAHNNFPGLSKVAKIMAPLHITNLYGPFAVMTRVRHEIIIEGSNNGVDWRAYGFRYKPDDIKKAPAWIIPHQPRMDWQMWFAALSTAGREPWFRSMLVRLLQGSEPVIKLFSYNPFPDNPPKYIRALFYEYQFTEPGDHHPQSQWWYRKPVGVYQPAVKLAGK